MPDIETRIVQFVKDVVSAMGLPVDVRLEATPDGPRLNLDGEGAELLLTRRGEPLQALQHVVDTVFRHDLGQRRRMLIDCLHFRKDKDAELRQMARFLADRAKRSGLEQKLGPLNAYERRIVHLTVAEDPSVVSESIGDAAVKTVIISMRHQK